MYFHNSFTKVLTAEIGISCKRKKKNLCIYSNFAYIIRFVYTKTIPE